MNLGSMQVHQNAGNLWVNWYHSRIRALFERLAVQTKAFLLSLHAIDCPCLS